MANIDAALSYLTLGWSVFPCATDKAPLTPRGFHDATLEPELVCAWWDRNPEALVGVAVPAGVVILDVDPRNGGDRELRDLILNAGKRLPTTLKARTGSGGTHYWYRLPENDVTNMRATLCLGVDVKQAGKGYVIAPPSVSDFGPYEWTTPAGAGAYIADLPAWIHARLQRTVDVIPPSVDLVDRPDWLPATDYGSAALRYAVDAITDARPGSRNNVLFARACGIYRLVAGGELDGKLATDELVSAGIRAGLPDFEVIHVLRSASGYGAREPRTAAGMRA